MSDIITRARALLADATPGPWEANAWYNCDDGGWAAIGPHHMATEDEGYDDVPESPAHHRAMADAALIAAAPELIAALCDEVASAERELLAIWATVRSGNPAPLTEREVLHAVEDMQRERDALRAEVKRMRARRPALCTRCYGDPGYSDPPGLYCCECGGSGAVIVEGEQ